MRPLSKKKAGRDFAFIVSAPPPPPPPPAPSAGVAPPLSGEAAEPMEAVPPSSVARAGPLPSAAVSLDQMVESTLTLAAASGQEGAMWIKVGAH